MLNARPGLRGRARRRAFTHQHRWQTPHLDIGEVLPSFLGKLAERLGLKEPVHHPVHPLTVATRAALRDQLSF
jgi:hypothetical protein